MNALAATDDLFFNKLGLDQQQLTGLTGDALHGADDGELYLEYSESEALVWDDGRIKSASFDTSKGFGLRSVAGERSGYAHSSDLSLAAMRRAADTVRNVQSGHQGQIAIAPRGTNDRLYRPENPLNEQGFDQKVALLATIDSYLRARDPRIKQVSVSMTGNWSAIQIIRPDGARMADLRPLVRLNISVVTGDGQKMESGSYGYGGRTGYDRMFDAVEWQKAADEALRMALVNLDAVPGPAGEMTVVVGPGWPGVLLHEAVGHGLEGDFNRKKTSAFAGLLGQRVAAPGVTVVDDGTLSDRRGSITIDDEGTPSAYNVLIEDGILKGYMQDRMNARLMGVTPTGNGRRESFAHPPMPRMTNTYMLNGPHDPQEMIASVQKGVYAVNFGGGQVDITSGKFVFSATEAYLIENGKIGPAIKGATLIGNGPVSLTRVSMIGNDMRLDDGIGTCGKAGQGVPVGVGQPSLKIEGLTVGGTAT